MTNEVALTKQQVATKRVEVVKQLVLLHEYLDQSTARVLIRQIDHLLELTVCLLVKHALNLNQKVKL